MMRHRDAWAVKEQAPTREAWQKEQEEERIVQEDDEPKPEGKRRVVASETVSEQDLPRDVLVVVSKLKAYVKARSGMNTSDAVAAVLSDYLRHLCTEAIRNAARDGRKTVLDRDFTPLCR